MLRTSLVAAAVAAASFGAHADLFDQNVTPDVIFGSGNANGSYTTDTANGVELGLRGKLRHNATGAPENTFNSNGDGTYSFAAGIAPTQAFPTAVWSFEWSINSNVDGTGGFLNQYLYSLGVDNDPSQGTSYSVFDPIHGIEPIAGINCWDHSLGTNATGNGAGIEVLASACRSAVPADKAAAETLYQTRLGQNNVAQNSWKAHWFLAAFDPTVDGTYNFFLSASDLQGNELARTDIQIIVGQGGAAVVPEPASLALIGVALAGLAVARRRRQQA